MEDGVMVIIVIEKIMGIVEKFGIFYQYMLCDVKLGECIFFDDGKLMMEIVVMDGLMEIKVKVLYGGILFFKKGVNFLNIYIFLLFLMEKDWEDFDFVLVEGVDWIGLSFVWLVWDIIELKYIIFQKYVKVWVVVKIEKLEVVDDIDEIIKVMDVFMVVCGDFGVEVFYQEVLFIQKMLIWKGYQYVKLVIVVM